MLTGTFRDSWYAIPNVLFAAASPHMMVDRRFPYGAWKALKVSMPISAMLSVCFISMALSAHGSSCVWDVFLFENGDISWSKALTVLLLPITAMFTLWVILASCNNGRIIDIGMILLTLSALRLLDDSVLPLVLSCTGISMLVAVRLYNHFYPKAEQDYE
jgi:hypothetical protein